MTKQKCDQHDEAIAAFIARNVPHDELPDLTESFETRESAAVELNSKWVGDWEFQDLLDAVAEPCSDGLPVRLSAVRSALRCLGEKIASGAELPAYSESSFVLAEVND